jgi:uncharacterized protein (DUF849 family)
MAAAQGKVIITCAITGSIHTAAQAGAAPEDARQMLKLKGGNNVHF